MSVTYKSKNTTTKRGVMFDLPDSAQQFVATPWMMELQGQVSVQRNGAERIIQVMHPSGVIAAQIRLDPINAAMIARGLVPPLNGDAS